jgi:hypothetical protein
MSMWQRQEIQKMLWRISVTLIAVGVSLNAALLPESFAQYKRGAVSPVTPENPAVWSEYGLQSAEKAEFSGAGRPFSVTAYRLNDPTGAFAAFQWQRPADAASAHVSAGFRGGALVAHENYLLRIEGAKPHPEELTALYKTLPNVVRTSLPPLYGYLPKRGRVANSERYFLGNSSLQQFEPRIPATLAALDRGAEAQSARYRSGGEEVQLTIISYPTPQMASERARAFASLTGAAVKRSGPLLAIVPEGAGKSAATRLLDEIGYKPNFTWNEYVSKDTPQDAAKMILAIMTLAGFLIVLSLVLGLFFGGSKILAKRFGMTHADGGFTSLHLDGK